MKTTSIILFVALSAAISACSDDAKQASTKYIAPDAIPFRMAYEEPASDVIQNGYGVLNLAYTTKIQPEDAYSKICNYTKIEKRHLVLCGINYGGPGIAYQAHWEILNEKGKETLLAMNGQAISDLKKIVTDVDDYFKKEGNFRVGTSERPAIPSTAFVNIFPKK
jgi:hypothetical protein